MPVKIITVHCVHQGDDDRSDGYPTFFFGCEGDAIVFAKGKGWYGGNAPTSKRQAVVMPDGNVWLLDARKEPIDLDGKTAKRKDEIRARAMAKLTAEEQLVLFGG